MNDECFSDRYAHLVRRGVILSIVLAGLLAFMAPAVPFLARYGAFPQKPTQPLTVVLAGVDVQYDEKSAVWPWPAKTEDFSGRTDTLLLAQLYPDGTTQLLSIPRDTWIDVPNYGWGKINGANVHGGSDMLINAVQHLTGVTVDGYALVSLNAVPALTDALGGAMIDVPSRMKYDDKAGNLHIDLQAGRQRLNGQQVEGFLRFRKDNLGDVGRIARQQSYISAMQSQVKNPLNWWRFPKVAAAIQTNTKSNLSKKQVGQLLGLALGGPKVNMHTVPGTFGAGGSWVVNTPALKTLLQSNFKNDQDPRNQAIAVLNIDAPKGSAARMKTKLETLGYQKVWIAEEPRGTALTTVSGSMDSGDMDSGDMAAQVLKDVGFGKTSKEANVPSANITIRLGSDTPAE